MSRSSPPIANYERIYDMRAKSLTRIVLTWVRRWLASIARALAVLNASRVHHNLSAVLGVAHNDTDLAARIQQHIAKAVTDRDEAIRTLKDHESTHAN